MENLFSLNQCGKLMCKEETRKSVIDSLVRTNSFVPKIASVRYHTSVKNGKGILNTVVTFVDGTTSVVRNDPENGDEIFLVKKEIILSDGSKKEILTASEQAKEIGLVYAIVKRVVCKLQGTGVTRPNGFIHFIRNLVKKAVVSDVLDTAVSAEREIARRRLERRKSEREGLLETIISLRKEIEGLNRRFADISKEGLVKNGGSDAAKGRKKVRRDLSR